MTSTSTQTPAGTFVTHSGGAQVEAWNSATFGPLVFSPIRADYRVGSSPHGGIPVCFPWFGTPKFASAPTEAPFLGRSDADFKHGFARLLEWTKTAEGVGPNGLRQVTYRLTSADVPEEYAPSIAPFVAEYTASFGETTMELSLSVTNTGRYAFTFEAALHTYFRVGEVHEVKVRGLEGEPYLDTAHFPHHSRTQEGPITFGKLVDRVFQTTNHQVIEDPSLGRQFKISTVNSGTTVVWNPGPEGDQMGELLPGEWKSFVCVETANAGPSAIVLDPGGRHTMEAHYLVESAF